MNAANVVMAAGLGGAMIQVLTVAGQGSMPSCELSPAGTVSLLQVCVLHLNIVFV